MIRNLLKRLKRPKQTRPKLYYEGAHDGAELPKDSLADSLIPLEPRFMFDAAGVATGAEVAAETVAQEQADQATENAQPEPIPAAVVESTEKLFESLSLVDGAANVSNEIVFIDTSVENYESLLEGIDENAEVVFIDSDSDGLQQIAEVLSEKTDVDAVHIIAHGDSGQLQLGNTVLTEQSMSGEHADELAQIGQSLSEQADILIYGCSFGAGEQGESAATVLSQMTGADIAASDDLTGSAELGGDWELEVKVGDIESGDDVFNSKIASWAGILAITPAPGATDAATAAEIAEGIDVVGATESSTGDANAVGTYAENDSGLGIGDGMYITTGDDTNLAGDGTAGNRTNVDNAGDDNDANHAVLDAIANQDLQDVSTFSFDFTGTAQKLAVTYILGTEETAGFAPTYNDVFAVIVTDTTGAVDTATDDVNSHFVANDWAVHTDTDPSIEANFRTNAITQFVTVDNSGGANNNVEFAVGDNSDTGYDTSVFVSYFGAALSIDADGSTAGNDFSTSYTEGASAVSVIDSDATLNQLDVAVTTIDSATITISPGTYQNGQDTLYFADQSGISGTFNAAAGTLTLTADTPGTVTTATFLAALKTVTFDSTDTPGSNRSVSIVVNDGTTDSNTATTTIDLLAANQEPTITLNSNTVGFTEDSDTETAVLFDTVLVNTVEASQRFTDIQLTMDNVETGDNLVFNGTTVDVDTDGFSVSAGGFTYDVSLVGSTATIDISHAGATNAEVNTVLNDITYINPDVSDDNLLNATRNITIVSLTDDGGTVGAGDDTANPGGATATVNITTINDAPVQTTNTGITLLSSATETIDNLEMLYTDPEGTPATSITYTVTTSPANGQLELATGPGVAITSFTQCFPSKHMRPN